MNVSKRQNIPKPNWKAAWSKKVEECGKRIGEHILKFIKLMNQLVSELEKLQIMRSLEGKGNSK